jgi:hypothetical protein
MSIVSTQTASPSDFYILRKREQQLIAVRVVDLNAIVSPPELFTGDGALHDLAVEFAAVMIIPFSLPGPS